MEAKELKKAVKDLLDKYEMDFTDFAHGEYDDEFESELKSVVGDIKNIMCKRTNGSGDYDGAQSIFYFKDHNTYLSIEGSYSSYGGMDFSYADDLDIVEPYKVEITKYKKVKG